MRRYLFLFFLFLILLLFLLGVIGTSVMTKAVGLQNSDSLLSRTQSIQEDLRIVYGMARQRVGGEEGLLAAVEEVAAEVDRLRGEAALLDIRKNYFRGAAIFLLATILITAAAGVMFWLGIMRIFIRPLERIADAMRRIGRGDFSISIKLSRTEEIRYIQEQVIQLAGEVKNSQDRIKEMERENIGRFLVHQVRNSITPIRLCADVLKAKTPSFISRNSDSREAVEIIEAEADKIERVINRFRNLYSFPAPIMGEIEVLAFLRGVLKSYPSAALETLSAGETGSPGSRGKEELTEEAKFYTRGDTNLLEQAMGNLLDNALEADPRGRVKIAVQFPASGGEGGKIIVEDKGSGIPAEIRDSIFADYVTTKKNGMGIGLSFVKRVLDLHGFSVTLDTEEGRGTRVIIGVPKK